MTDGVLDIQLVPGWSPSSVKWDLTAALARAQYLQAGIGYWTISDTLLGSDLARTLRDDDGFVCVDLHLPTDVDQLAALAAQGAQVRVYHEEIRTYGANGRKEPPQLLHSKMLLFWSKDRTAELWVGSHNWTNRALLGLNVEASLVIRLRDTSPLFRSATGYLAQIKKISTPFELAKVDFYREVQRRSALPAAPVIELEADDAGRFAGVTVAIFGTDTTELAPARHDAARARRTVRPRVRNGIRVFRIDSPRRPSGCVGCGGWRTFLLSAPLRVQARAVLRGHRSRAPDRAGAPGFRTVFRDAPPRRSGTGRDDRCSCAAQREYAHRPVRGKPVATTP